MSVGDDALEVSGLQQLSVFVGPNNAGKTNVLRAIELIIESLQGPVLDSSLYYHNLEIDNQFRIGISVEFDDGEKNALVNSVISSVLMEPIVGTPETQPFDILRTYLVRHELKKFLRPTFEDFVLTLNGSGSESYPPEIGFISRWKGRVLYCHNLGFITDESPRPQSYTQVQPIGFLISQLKSVNPSLEEFLRGNNPEMPKLQEQESTIFDVKSSQLGTKGPIGIQINRWSVDSLEPKYKDLEILHELRRFFRARGVPFTGKTTVGLPDLLKLIFLTSVVRLSDVRGYPGEHTVEEFQPNPTAGDSLSNDSLPELLFRLRNSDLAKDRRRFNTMQQKFTELTDGLRFDLSVKTRMIQKSEGGRVTPIQGYNSGLSMPGDVIPIGIRQEVSTQPIHKMQIEIMEGELSFPVEFAAAGVYELLLLSTVIVGHHDGIILLDEPAQNLHPTLQNRVLNLIDESVAKDNNQFLIITHSPYFVSAAMLNATWRFEKEKGITRAINVGESLGRLQEEDQAKILIKMASSEIRSLLFSRGVVLVEGPSDRIVVEKVDQALSLSKQSCDLQGKEWTTIDIGGKKNLGTFMKLCSLLGLRRIAAVDYDSLMRCEHKIIDKEGHEVKMSAVLFYLYSTGELSTVEFDSARQLATRMHGKADDEWYTDYDLSVLRKLAMSHGIFVFQMDLEGALQTSVTKKQSKPLKSLEAVLEQTESGNLSPEFYELGQFLLASIS